VIITAAQYQQKEDYVSSSNLSGYAAALERLKETAENS
jgi:hypothetical protein